MAASRDALKKKLIERTSPPRGPTSNRATAIIQMGDRQTRLRQRQEEIRRGHRHRGQACPSSRKGRADQRYFNIQEVRRRLLRTFRKG